MRKTALISGLIAILMFGFSFALVPLYNLLCKKGVYTVVRSNEKLNQITPDFTRKMNIQFVTTNNANLPWEFYPTTNNIDTYPDQTVRVTFFAKNNSNKTMTIQAVPSYSPSSIIPYFHKTECFCFNKQTLKAGESITMPVVFFIDKEAPRDIQMITLAYTLFDITPKSS